jgi:hypothetical protein
MHIDRSNYEIWFIDWLDGNLNSLQVKQLELFLEQNPDLREEFSDFSPVKLAASAISFRDKEQLKKSPSDITPAQFGYLCAAYLENDLTVSQRAELSEIIDKYPERQKTFDLMHKTRLTPERIIYKHKNLLLKRTISQKILWLSVTGISTAAAIALVIIAVSALLRTTTSKFNNSAHIVVSDSTSRRSSSTRVADGILKDRTPFTVEKKRNDRFADIHGKDIIADFNLKPPVNDSLVRQTDIKRMTISKVPVCPQIALGKGIVSNKIIAYNQGITIPDAEDERGRAGRFISKTFREKFLKEKAPPDTPIKGYEIAEAGISGLNKLFGWQIVLDMKNDENGQPRSVYFSSKTLKVSAPVKKREPLP